MTNICHTADHYSPVFLGINLGIEKSGFSENKYEHTLIKWQPLTRVDCLRQFLIRDKLLYDSQLQFLRVLDIWSCLQ